MCKVTEQGYQLKCSDRIITSADLDTLTKEEMAELLTAPITAWELLHLRKQNHHIINSLSAHILEQGMDFQEIKNSLVEIKDSLFVEIQNGKRHRKKMSELVVELYDLHKSERKRSRLFASLKENRISLILILITLIIGSIYYHPLISSGLQKAQSYILPILGAGIIAPLIVILLTNLFKK